MNHKVRLYLCPPPLASLQKEGVLSHRKWEAGGHLRGLYRWDERFWVSVERQGTPSTAGNHCGMGRIREHKKEEDLSSECLLLAKLVCLSFTALHSIKQAPDPHSTDEKTKVQRG
jgi:hypothetical protein